MDLEVLGCGEREEEADGVGLGDGCKRLSEVDARFLCETLCNKSGLVSRDLAGRRTFDTEDPLAADTGGKGSINQGIHADYIVIF